jgi:peptide/nickel transport system substrate-binding protein
MKRIRLAVAASIAVAALTLTACSSGSGGAAVSAGGKPGLTLGILQEPASWSPTQAHVGHLLQPYQVVYDTLILRKPDGTYAPMLATEWKYTDATNLVFQLKLRSGVSFSDGEKFNAAAVKANLEAFGKDNGRQKAQLAAVESVTAVDDSTVEVKLKAQDPAFEYYLSQAAGLMASPKALGTDDLKRNPVGTGPYVMVKDQSVVGTQYVFTPRQGYWNTDLQKFSKVTLKLLADTTARVNAVTSGQVDATLLTAATMAQADAKKLTKLAYPTDWTGLLIFDRDGKIVPELKNPKVRQAMNHAFDRASMLKSLAGGQGDVTSQVFGPASGAYLPELDNRYPFDKEKAKALLAEAGVGPFTIEMPVLSGQNDREMTFVAQALGDIGITVKQTAVPLADYQGLLGQGKFAVAWFSLFQGVPWVAVNQMIVPNTLYNPFKTTNPEIEALIAAVRDGGKDSAEKAKAVNTYVTEQAWFIPWYRPAQLYYFDAAKVKVTPQTQQAVPSIYNYEPAK